MIILNGPDTTIYDIKNSCMKIDTTGGLLKVKITCHNLPSSETSK